VPYTHSSSAKTYHFDEKSILGQLDDDTTKLILMMANKLHIYRTKVIVEEHTENLNLYFVLSGSVRASYISRDGKEISLADIGPGDCFGEFSAIDGQLTSASVIASEECQIAVIGRRDFLRLLAESQSFVQVLLRHLVSKIRQRTIRIIEFSSLPVGHRVRAELLRLATPLIDDRNAGVISHPPTQRELANFISSHREAIAREMAELVRSGLITKNNGKITIHSLSRLRASIIGATEII